MFQNNQNQMKRFSNATADLSGPSLQQRFMTQAGKQRTRAIFSPPNEIPLMRATLVPIGKHNIKKLNNSIDYGTPSKWKAGAKFDGTLGSFRNS